MIDCNLSLKRGLQSKNLGAFSFLIQLLPTSSAPCKPRLFGFDTSIYLLSKTHLPYFFFSLLLAVMDFPKKCYISFNVY